MVVLWFATSCVGPESVPCADGTVCPRDRVCWLIGESYQCVSDEQIVACDGKPDFAACSGGTCLGGACLTPSCGDGRIGPIEVCDDGNTATGDGCSSDCRSDETCGNGVVDLQVGEQCDDGAVLGGLSHDGCSSTCLEERPEWRLIPDYDEMVNASDDWNAVYDPARGNMVLVASVLSTLHTFVIDDGVWTEVSPLVSPGRRSGFALVHDPHRRRTVMFGGFGLRDTWEWDGTTWSLRQPATSPATRTVPAVAYDPIGRRVVMFGGRSSFANTNSELDDTWVWDGTNWTELVGPGPSKRAAAAMAFDPVRGVIVLYGGSSETNTSLDDTWELTGDTWAPRASAVNPGPRTQHSMAFDPVSRRVLAYGGKSGVQSSETLAWDGTTWSVVATDLRDPGGAKIVTITHEQRVTQLSLSGGFDWNGAGWTRLFTPSLSGMRRSGVAAAVDFDHRRIVVFGGYDASSLTDRTDIGRGIWTRYAGAAPPARSSSAMAYDPERQEFVMFGGEGTSATLGDTWIFDGAWTQRTPASSPSTRSSHSMVYDAKRRAVVLFGGLANGSSLGDTWTWNGTEWAEVVGAGPPARHEAGATYDPIREETVVFGGTRRGAPPLGDTWAWNGVWTKRSDVGPTPRGATAMAWDSARRRAVIFGGATDGATFNDVWEWDGSNWIQVAATALPGRAGHVLVSALDGAGVLRFGTFDDVSRDQIAQLRWSSNSARESCVVGEDFDGDGTTEPVCGGGDPDCWIVCAPTCPPATSCPATATGCGDGTCTDGRETCRSCPADCGACPAACGDLACNGGETHATCVADCP